MFQLASHLIDFCEIWYGEYSRKSLEQFKIWSKSDKKCRAFYMKNCWVCHIVDHDICSARRETTHCCASWLRFQCLLHYWQQYMNVSNTNGTHCCVSIVTVVTRKRHDFTLYAHCLSCCYFYYLYSVSVRLQLRGCNRDWSKDRRQFGFMEFFLNVS